MKQIYFILGLAVGYVVGTRRGREGYEKLKRRAANLWTDRRVQGGVRDAQQFVRENAPAASGALTSVVEKANEASTAATPAENLPGNI